MRNWVETINETIWRIITASFSEVRWSFEAEISPFASSSFSSLGESLHDESMLRPSSIRFVWNRRPAWAATLEWLVSARPDFATRRYGNQKARLLLLSINSLLELNVRVMIICKKIRQQLVASVVRWFRELGSRNRIQVNVCYPRLVLIDWFVTRRLLWFTATAISLTVKLVIRLHGHFP